MANPTGYAGPPITTHQWLQPLYHWLKGWGTASVFTGPTGARFPAAVQFGFPTGILGFYGATGTLQPTGLGSTGSAAGGGVTGTTFFDIRSNGGTGANYYTLTDIVNALKLEGLLAK